MTEQIKPGFFGRHVSADDSRRLLDFKNDQYLTLGKKAKWLFYGDSITDLWDIPLYFSYQNGLIIKRAICGDSAEFANKRFEADVLQLEPENIIMLIGVNDIRTMDPDLWWRTEGKDRELILKELKWNIEDMIIKSKGINLYLCSILPTFLCLPFDRKLMDEMIRKANVIIRDLCEKYNVKYIDYYSEMYDESIGGLYYDMSYDGLHPCAKGYMKMADILKREIGLI